MTMFKRGRNSVGGREQGRKRGGIKIEPRELKRWGEADGLRTVANFGNYCDSHADFERVFVHLVQHVHPLCTVLTMAFT